MCTSLGVTATSCFPSGDHASSRAPRAACTASTAFESTSTTVTPPRGVAYARMCRSGCHAGATCAARASSTSPVPSPATTRRPPALRYAIRVSARVPPQRGNRTPGRESVQRTVPRAGSTAASVSPLATTTKSPCGDHDACPSPPRRRFDPSAATTHVPPAPLTSSRPGAGSLKRAGAACSTPIVRRTASTTARPGGENAVAATTATATTGTASGQRRRATCARSRRAYAAPHDGPGPLLRRGVDRHLLERLLHVHRSSSPRRSSPRRSRELTVPRGSSSNSAISPGVYSSR